MDKDLRDEPQQQEEFGLELEPKQQYLHKVHAQIASDRARTENSVALTLIWSLVLSLPVYILALYVVPDKAAAAKEFLDKWFTVMGPLAGAAVGVGYRRSLKHRS